MKGPLLVLGLFILFTLRSFAVELVENLDLSPELFFHSIEENLKPPSSCAAVQKQLPGPEDPKCQLYLG